MSIYSSKKPETSRVMAIDYGKAKVGLAMADMETKIAFAYNTLENNEKFLDNLIEIIKKEGIDKIIIGIPEYNLSNCHPELDSGPKNRKIGCRNKFGMTKCIEYEKLGQKLKEKINVEIEYQDEMFTTKMAEDKLKEKGIKNIKRFDDQEAAKIILQDWLDKT